MILNDCKLLEVVVATCNSFPAGVKTVRDSLFLEVIALVCLNEWELLSVTLCAEQRCGLIAQTSDIGKRLRSSIHYRRWDRNIKNQNRNCALMAVFD